LIGGNWLLSVGDLYGLYDDEIEVELGNPLVAEDVDIDIDEADADADVDAGGM
jgi:hypothetical protein